MQNKPTWQNDEMRLIQMKSPTGDLGLLTELKRGCGFTARIQDFRRRDRGIPLSLAVITTAMKEAGEVAGLRCLQLQENVIHNEGNFMLL